MCSSLSPSRLDSAFYVRTPFGKPTCDPIRVRVHTFTIIFQSIEYYVSDDFDFVFIGRSDVLMTNLLTKVNENIIMLAILIIFLVINDNKL